MPVVLLFGVLVLSLYKRIPAGGEKFLRRAGGVWGALLLSRGLRRCGERLELTGGGEEGTAVWIILLVSLPLVWMALGRAGAFFRMAEVCALAVAVTVTAVLLWGTANVKGEYLLLPAESISGGFWAAVEAGGTFLFALPYIYRTKPAAGDGRRTFLSLAALSAGAAALSAVTVGVLSPRVAALAKEPFFTMTAALGRSFRVEGLISALWLIPELVYFALLAGCGFRENGERNLLSATVILLGVAAAIFPLSDGVGPGFWGAGTVVFGCVILLVPAANRTISGRLGKGKTTSCG